MKQLQQSGEDYIETIYVLHRQGGAVHSVDVADALGFSRPSVCRAVGKLREAGLLTMQPDGSLLLTPAGEDKARAVYERHRLLTQFLVRTLGVCEETAAQDACRIEHVISDETFGRIRASVMDSVET